MQKVQTLRPAPICAHTLFRNIIQRFQLLSLTISDSSILMLLYFPFLPIKTKIKGRRDLDLNPHSAEINCPVEHFLWLRELPPH